MTLTPYDSDDAVRQIRYADGHLTDLATAGTMPVIEHIKIQYLRAIAVGLAAVAAQLEG